MHILSAAAIGILRMSSCIVSQYWASGWSWLNFDLIADMALVGVRLSDRAEDGSGQIARLLFEIVFMPLVFCLLLHRVLAALFSLCFFLLFSPSFALALCPPPPVIFIMRLPAGHFSITWPCNRATVGHDYSDATTVCVRVCVLVCQPLLASCCRRCVTAAWRMSWTALRGRGCCTVQHTHPRIFHVRTYSVTCLIVRDRCISAFSDLVIFRKLYNVRLCRRKLLYRSLHFLYIVLEKHVEIC